MKLTPAMQQFMKVKNEHPDCLLLFRMGDFYETFFDDAKKVSRALNIVLTSRGNDKVPLAGIPYHSIDPYINKLIKQGYKVAIVEQLEDPKTVKGRVVKRGLDRIITPGTVLDNNALDEKFNNYLLSISPGEKKDDYGLAVVDVSTGEFLCTDASKSELIDEINKFRPSEIIVPSINNDFSDYRNYFINKYNDVFYYYDNAKENLMKHFELNSLKGFGIEGKKSVVSACGALISYLKETQMTALSNVISIKYYKQSDYMALDPTTIRNLELINSIYDNSQKGTLVSVIDNSQTPMGSRKLKSWITRPLIKKHDIISRHEAVTELYNNKFSLDDIRKKLKNSLDIQRLLSRISNNVNCPKDLLGLKKSLMLMPELKELVNKKNSKLLNDLFNFNIDEIVNLIDNSIVDEAPSHIRDGNFIKRGFSRELDELKDISKNAKKFILELETKEKERTGIKSLKIRFNKIFGYFIEVTKSNLSNVPENYIRKQTQVNSERFITEDLKEKEELILTASEKQLSIEQKLYEQIVSKVIEQSKIISLIAEDFSTLDVISNFAYVSIENSYVKPIITDFYEFKIMNGRHPVIEKFQENYVPNDCVLNDNKQMMIITGPNMSGKSSFMRQNALIIILAQIGCFVPAKQAEIGIVDRIFTRIGAFDDLSSGQSTFMMEMNETSNIVNNATKSSFIILDEIGRGTSTYDGISLAWAIAEYVINKIKAKTMFATHYHQLNRLSEHYSNIKNYNISVIEEKDKIIFLHKIEEGGTNRSYGIEVAKLAGLPKELIDNAKTIMQHLEVEDEVAERLFKPGKKKQKINLKDIDMKQFKIDDYI